MGLGYCSILALYLGTARLEAYGMTIHGYHGWEGSIMSKTAEIFLFFSTSALIMIMIRLAVKGVLYANIPRKKARKVIQKPSIGEGILLTYTLQYVRKHTRFCKIMVSVNCIYLLFMMAFIVLALLSNFSKSFLQAGRVLFILKGLVLDLPIMVFFFFATRNSKRGGVKWIFEEDGK